MSSSSVGDIGYLDQVTVNSPVVLIKQIIIDAKSYKQDPEVTALILEAIWMLGMSQENRLAMAPHTPEEVIISALDIHFENLNVVSAAFAALKSVLINSYDFVLRKGIGLKILQAMEKYKSKAKLLEHACTGISVLAKYSQRTAEYFFEIGISSHILAAMKLHQNSYKLQIAAIAAVLSLAITEEIRDGLWRQGHCHFTLEAMNRNPTREELQIIGMQAITNFEYPFCNARLYAYETCLRAMQRFPANIRIVSSGCRFLRYIGQITSTIPVVVSDGAVSTIISCLEEFPKKKIVQETGCKAIWTLAALEEVKDSLLQEGTIEYLSKLTRRYRKYSEVVFPAIGCIGTLINKSARAQRVLQTNVPSYIIAASRTHMDNHRLQDRVIIVFKNLSLSWSDEQRNKLLDSGLKSLIEDILTQFSKDSSITTRGNQILDKLNSSDS